MFADVLSPLREGDLAQDSPLLLGEMLRFHGLPTHHLTLRMSPICSRGSEMSNEEPEMPSNSRDDHKGRAALRRPDQGRCSALWFRPAASANGRLAEQELRR
jgi:hypothetical protein